MNLTRFTDLSYESYGILLEYGVLDLLKFAGRHHYSLSENLEGLISNPKTQLKILEKHLEDLTDVQRAELIVPKEKIRIKSPLVSPPKIICIGLNYEDHAREVGAPIPEEPVIFMKPRTAIIGLDENIIKPSFVTQLDYEVELGIIIGKKGRNISKTQADKYIFGYTVFNDISARDIQFKDGQWTRGKSFDTFAPIGPCIISKDQINDPNNLQLLTRVNGEIRQQSCTDKMIFSIQSLIYHVSRVMTLEPCDIIATGTPPGVAVFMKPEPKFLQPGDFVETEIENIGVLRNRVVSESR